MEQSSPYSSPTTKYSCHRSWRAYAAVTVAGLLTIALNVNSVVHNWRALTPSHYIVGLTLWLALPVIGVYLLLNNRAVGRWVLVGLFGLRLAMGILDLAQHIRLIQHDMLLIFSVLRGELLVTGLYAITIVWLASEPALRPAARERLKNDADREGPPTIRGVRSSGQR